MRTFMGLLVLLMTSHVSAAPTVLTAEVDYDFVDQNGFGWAVVAGKVTVVLTFAGKASVLTIKGKRRWLDGHVKLGNSGSGPGMDTSRKWEGDADETLPLVDVVSAPGGITFKLAPGHDQLTGSCAPIKLKELARTTLYECTITGFKWHTIANLPELHHPLVLDANVRAKARILNSLSGAAKPAFGRRSLSEAKPAPKR